MVKTELVHQIADVVNMKKELKSTIEKASALPIGEQRLSVLQTLIDYIQAKRNANESINLNFICTHNSRRSQLSQIWAKTAAHINGIDVNVFSGGVEVTAFNERAVASCGRLGFDIEKLNNSENPEYIVHIDQDINTKCFSKVYDHADNPKNAFAAVMTCSDADENCPFIPGTEKRIPLTYEDPKSFDNTDKESEMYDKRSLQIASELLYVFEQIDKN